MELQAKGSVAHAIAEDHPRFLAHQMRLSATYVLRAHIKMRQERHLVSHVLRGSMVRDLVLKALLMDAATVLRPSIRLLRELLTS